MREIVRFLHSHQQHYILIVDPAVAKQDYPPFAAFTTHISRNLVFILLELLLLVLFADAERIALF